MRNGSKRELEFLPNKVNIITGDSQTGKTVIWAVIDYCLFSSEPKIPYEFINENVEWYGINFNINESLYTIARQRLDDFMAPSSNYFFSGVGEIPEVPVTNNKDDDIKTQMEAEFQITDEVVMPYGGHQIPLGSKISLRYFMLFNSQDENTITNSDVFFDKQTNQRYKDALERIFNLSTGISTIAATAIDERINKLEAEKKRLQRKSDAFEKEGQLFEQNMKDIILEAKEYLLLDDRERNFDEEIQELKEVIYEHSYINISTQNNEYEKYEKERLDVLTNIRKLRRFDREYNEYKNILKKNYDSLLPIEYIHDNFSEIIESPLVSQFVLQLKEELGQIKRKISKNAPVQIEVKAKIRSLEKELTKIKEKLQEFPTLHRDFENFQEKYILIGEIKTKLEFYERKWDDANYEKQIKSLEDQIEKLKKEIVNLDERKEAVIRLLNELVQYYLNEASDALGNYAGYKAAFDYKTKKLRLQRPYSTIVELIGSSSNHLFLHLCLFLGLHELIMRQDVPYIPPFLFLDQPSRPYFDNKRNEAKSDTDRAKITIAIRLLNDFITRANNEKGLQREFQFIVVEHIPKDIWEENDMTNVHLVEEFFDGNKLIRDEDIMR